MFEATSRAYVWPVKDTDEHLAPGGRVMEILSEHTCQGWPQGYLLTGRHGLFPCYEAFIAIVDSMVNQYAKFLKQSAEIPWRAPVAPLNILLTAAHFDGERWLGQPPGRPVRLAERCATRGAHDRLAGRGRPARLRRNRAAVAGADRHITPTPLASRAKGVGL